MPSMYEIYDHYADRYDALVEREDYSGNLRRALAELAEWRDAVVVEAGIGTGRVTRTFVTEAAQILGFDRAPHMLERAARNLAPWTGKLRLAPAGHESLPVPDRTADIFIEGWAFGHVVVDQPEAVVEVTRRLVAEAARVTRRDGAILFIETLGTNVDASGAPDQALEQFYRELEDRHGFRRTVIATDYRFESIEEAVDLMGFFFGREMGESVSARLEQKKKQAAGDLPDGLIVPEFTGIWSRQAGPEE